MRHSRLKPRGTIYTLMLGVAMLLTVVGVGAVLAARVSLRSATASDDWNEAGLTAYSACELALSQMNAAAAASPSAWRNGYTSGETAFSIPWGRGTLSWALVDPNGDFSDDYTTPFTIYGIGKVGVATRVYSVQVGAGGRGIDALRAAVHAAGSLSTGGVTIAVGGPLSTNGRSTLGGTVHANVESAGKATGSLPVSPSVLIANAAAKTMPSSHAFATYRSKATALPASSFSGSTFAHPVVSNTTAPGGVTNPDGLYYLQLPSAGTVTIRASHIKGTLVIDGSPNQASQTLVLNGDIYWEPQRSDYPILITRGVHTVRFNGQVSRTSPTPGASLPSELNGLIHLAGTTTVQLRTGFYLHGCLIADGAVSTSGDTAILADPSLLATPPNGYQVGNVLTPIPGTWDWSHWP